MTIRNNSALPNNHFNKNNKRYKMWFNQSIQKTIRRKKRMEKAKNLYPAPLKRLRPIVNCQSQRYQHKKKLGKGFTIHEIAEAGFKSINEAKSLRVAVDQKRKNKSQETFDQNVARLKEYLSKTKNFSSREEAVRENVPINTKTLMPLQKLSDLKIEFIDSKNISTFSV